MKTWPQYLAENDNDPARAAAAMARDHATALGDARAEVQREIAQNQSARRQAQAFRKLAASLGVDTDVLDQEGLSAERRAEVLNTFITQVNEAVTAGRTDAGEVAGVLTQAGFDLDAYRKAGKDKRGEIVAAFLSAVRDGTARAAELQQQINLRDAATELGVDPKKLAAIKGSEGIKRGKVKVKAEDGTETEQDAWVLADGTTELRGHITGLGFSLEQLAPAKAPEQAQPEDDLGAPVAGAQKPAAGKAGEFDWLK